jgi:hypothetical protein
MVELERIVRVDKVRVTRGVNIAVATVRATQKLRSSVGRRRRHAVVQIAPIPGNFVSRFRKLAFFVDNKLCALDRFFLLK